MLDSEKVHGLKCRLEVDAAFRWSRACFTFHKHFDELLAIDKEWFIGQNGVVFILPTNAWCKLLSSHKYYNIDKEHLDILRSYEKTEKKKKGDSEYINKKLGYTNKSIFKDSDVANRIGYPTGTKIPEESE